MGNNRDSWEDSVAILFPLLQLVGIVGLLLEKLIQGLGDLYSRSKLCKVLHTFADAVEETPLGMEVGGKVLLLKRKSGFASPGLFQCWLRHIALRRDCLPNMNEEI